MLCLLFRGCLASRIQDTRGNNSELEHPVATVFDEFLRGVLVLGDTYVMYVCVCARTRVGFVGNVWRAWWVRGGCMWRGWHGECQTPKPCTLRLRRDLLTFFFDLCFFFSPFIDVDCVVFVTVVLE